MASKLTGSVDETKLVGILDERAAVLSHAATVCGFGRVDAVLTASSATTFEEPVSNNLTFQLGERRKDPNEEFHNAPAHPAAGVDAVRDRHDADLRVHQLLEGELHVDSGPAEPIEPAHDQGAFSSKSLNVVKCSLQAGSVERGTGDAGVLVGDGKLLAAAKLRFPKFYPVVLFLFETGVRKSEAINLPWSNVVFEQKIARIWSSTDADVDDDEEDSDDEAYTVKSVEREVPLSDQMIVVLKEQKLTGLSPVWVFPATTDRCHTKGERYAFFPKYTWTRLLAKATS